MPQPPLDGTILVTGASSGIGRAIATQLAPQASRLVLVARRADRLHELATALARPGLDIDVRPIDITDRDAVDAMLADVGPIDVLVNNAGYGDLALFERSDRTKLFGMIALNNTALVHLTHALVPGMIRNGRGGILNISSGFGITWAPSTAVYAATKHFVTAFTDVLHVELRAHGIAVTQALPGPVRTEFLSIAGNPTPMDVPSFVELDADTCARQALGAFRKGHARVVPGLLMRAVLGAQTLVPRSVLRLFYAPVARYLRAQET